MGPKLKARRRPPLPPPARLHVFPPLPRLPADRFSENGVSGRCDRERWGEEQRKEPTNYTLYVLQVLARGTYIFRNFSLLKMLRLLEFVLVGDRGQFGAGPCRPSPDHLYCLSAHCHLPSVLSRQTRTMGRVYLLNAVRLREASLVQPVRDLCAVSNLRFHWSPPCHLHATTFPLRA